MKPTNKLHVVLAAVAGEAEKLATAASNAGEAETMMLFVEVRNMLQGMMMGAYAPMSRVFFQDIPPTARKGAAYDAESLGDLGDAQARGAQFGDAASGDGIGRPGRHAEVLRQTGGRRKIVARWQADIRKLLTISVATLRPIAMGQHAMPMMSLREAARATGLSKSTISRAISRGKMSATRNDIGGWDIDPSELFRVFQPRTPTDPVEPAAMGQITTAQQPDETPALRAENEGLKAQLAMLRDQVEDLRRQRDNWQADISRRLLADQRTAPAAGRRAGWFGWRRAG